MHPSSWNYETKYNLEAYESTCHERPSNYEVENYNQYIDVEKEEINIMMWYEK